MCNNYFTDSKWYVVRVFRVLLIHADPRHFLSLEPKQGFLKNFKSYATPFLLFFLWKTEASVFPCEQPTFLMCKSRTVVVCVRVCRWAHVFWGACPKLTGYMDSPSCLYIKRKWDACFTYTHTDTHTHICVFMYLPFSNFDFISFTFSLFSSVRVKCERVSRSGCSLPVSLSEVCVCNIYFIGISLSPCWVAAGHVIMFWAVKGHHCHSWKMRCGCERDRWDMDPTETETESCLPCVLGCVNSPGTRGSVEVAASGTGFWFHAVCRGKGEV